MSRFYVSPDKVGAGEIIVNGPEARHILDVMRLKKEDKVVVFDGTGVEYTGFITKADTRGKKLVVEIICTKKPAADSMPEITLAHAIPKKAKMEYIVEKATELGVSNIIPLVTDRTIVRPDESSRLSKSERWQKIAVEAAKQCGRTNIPEVKDVAKF